MEPIEIFGAVIGILSLVAFLVLMFFGIASCEKTEGNKREFYKELTKYYKHRNEMFEKESEDNK